MNQISQIIQEQDIIGVDSSARPQRIYQCQIKLMSDDLSISNRVGSCLQGVLLGTALGDALGVPVDGLNSRQIARRFGEVRNFHFAAGMGFVSDDTEQTALLARAIAMNPDDAAACAEDFKKSLLGWFLRMPTGTGLATLRACLNILFRAKKTGINSAGNGSAMRAAIIGVFFHESAKKRQDYGKAICKITHTDPRALAATLFVAELAAACTRNARQASCKTCFDEAFATVENPPLRERLQRAAKLAGENASIENATKDLNCTGFVLHSVPLAAFCFLRFGDGDAMDALSQIISAGGDTDTNAAILGACLGAKKGDSGLGTELVDGIIGPFGSPFLRRMAKFLTHLKRGDLEDENEVSDEDSEVPGYNLASALTYNLTFLLLVLIHLGIRSVYLVLDLVRK